MIIKVFQEMTRKKEKGTMWNHGRQWGIESKLKVRILALMMWECTHLLPLLLSKFVLNCLFIKNRLKIRGLLWLRIQAAACQQREASLAVTTVCFTSEQVHPVPPSLTGTALTIERHQTEKKKKQMSENVLGRSFQLAKCLHDSMNTDEHYQPV